MEDMDKILDDILAEFGSDSIADELGITELLEERETPVRTVPTRRNTVSVGSRGKKSARPAPKAETAPVPPDPEASAPAEQSSAVVLSDLDAPTAQEPVKKKQEKTPRPKKERPEKAPTSSVSGGRKAACVLGRIGVVLLLTVVLLVGTLYGVMYILAKGPSVTARDLFVRSVRETSAVGFLANLYFSEEEIAEIERVEEEEVYQETDTSLVTITKPEEHTDAPVADEWGFIDEDGDGIILDQVKGEGYSGYMMIVKDPSRVIMGSVPTSYGGRGYTVEQMVQHFDAVAGINAGGFYDPDGTGDGSIPDTLVVYEGEIYYAGKGVRNGFVGLDSNHILHVGKLTAQEIQERDIQYGVCFGPVLIANGEVALAEDNVGGLNPRTAIGQRSDGAILMLVIDGRQAISIGATYADLVDIFLEYGAVNACNLDGGSSTLMWYDGGYVNNCASVIGIRPVPTSFVVLKEGE